MKNFLRAYAVVILVGVVAAAYSFREYTRERSDMLPTATTTVSTTTVSTSTGESPMPTVETGKSVRIGDTIVKVDIADTPQKREQGLSGRQNLADGEGMLFIFPESGLHGFWMKDMHFSIDIIWLDDAGKIVHIEPNVTPESFPASFSPQIPAKFVLEVPAGYAAAHSFGLGDTATLPE